jgi:hypothetical protein
MCFERQPGSSTGTLDHASEPGSRERRTALRGEDERRSWLLLTLSAPKRAQFIANDRVRRRRPLLDATDVQGGGREVDLLPSQIDQLAGPKAVAVGDEQHRAIAAAIAIAPSCGQELLDLRLGEVLTRAQLAIWSVGRLNCSISGSRCNQPKVFFPQEFRPSVINYCSYNRLTTNGIPSSDS